MKLPPDELEPIMTNSENINNFGANAYGKPATALNVLRETVMGRELFDYAFKEYARRWAFKHPTPADFFRTMEDASSVDLDWFWRGWFYDIEPVDISMDSVKVYTIHRGDTLPKARERAARRVEAPDRFMHISRVRNKAEGMSFLVDQDTTLRDFYFYYRAEDDSFKIPPMILTATGHCSTTAPMPYTRSICTEIHFSNKGGCVMPIILRWNYVDGTHEDEYISAYIWRKDEIAW